MTDFRSKIDWSLLAIAVNARTAQIRKARGRAAYSVNYLQGVYKDWHQNKEVKKVIDDLLKDGK